MNSNPLNSKLKNKKREAVVKVIHGATQEIWVTQGYRAIGMARIASKIGVAVGTLYNYFQSKEQLIESLIASQMSEFISCLLEEVENLGDVVLDDKIEFFLTALYEGHPCIDVHRKFLILAYGSEPSYFSAQNFFLESHLCPALASWLEKLRDQGLIHTKDAFLTSYLWLTVAKGLFDLYRREKITLPTAKSFVKSSYLQTLGV